MPDLGKRAEQESLIRSLHKALTLSGGIVTSEVTLPVLRQYAWLNTITHQKTRVIRIWESTLLIWCVGEDEPREVNRLQFESAIESKELIACPR